MSGAQPLQDDDIDLNDPTLAACCIRDLKEQRQHRKLLTKLDKVDVAAVRLRNLRDAKSWAIDPQDLPALQSNSQGHQHDHCEHGCSTACSHATDGARSDEDSDEGNEDFDDDDDDEFMRDLVLQRMQIAQARQQHDVDNRIQSQAFPAWADQLGYGKLTQLNSSAALPLNSYPRLVLVAGFGNNSQSMLIDLVKNYATHYKGTKFTTVGSELGLITPNVRWSRQVSDIIADYQRNRVLEQGGLVFVVKGEQLVDRYVWQPKGLELSDTSHLLEEFEQWLAKTNVLQKEVSQDQYPRQSHVVATPSKDGSDSGDDSETEYYDCGLKNCKKVFAHEHVGPNAKSSKALSAWRD